MLESGKEQRVGQLVERQQIIAVDGPSQAIWPNGFEAASFRWSAATGQVASLATAVCR